MLKFWYEAMQYIYLKLETWAGGGGGGGGGRKGDLTGGGDEGIRVREWWEGGRIIQLEGGEGKQGPEGGGSKRGKALEGKEEED